jgi:NADPH2:quinone reductase
MRVLRIDGFGEPENLRFVDVPTPEPAAGQVRIDVHAAGVNYPDLLVVQGKYQILSPLPFGPGQEVAGIISAVGAGVGDFVPGQRVMAQVENGGYAEQIVAPAAFCCPLPEDMDYADAVGFGRVYLTAHFALFERGHLKSGETVLVTGATGGVGIATVQLARAFGARVLAGVGTMEKAHYALQNGADAVIDLRSPDLIETMRTEVAAANNGRGANVIIEILGGKIFDACLRSLAWSGRIVVIGFASGGFSNIRSNYLLIKNITATGLHWSDYRERDPALVRRVQEEIFAWWRKGQLRSPVTATYPLEQAAAVLRRVAERKVLGKFVLLTDRYEGTFHGAAAAP